MLKIIKEITPVFIEGLDCVDNTVLTVCNCLCGEYEKAFWDSWDIRYRPDYIAGRGLRIVQGRIQENVRKLYGIEFVPQGAFDRGDCRGLIERYMSEDGLLVVGIKTNAFPWAKAYNQDVQGVHFLLFTKSSDSGIVCIDTMPARQDALLGWEDARRGVVSLIRIRDLRKQNEIKMSRVWKHVRKNVQSKSVRLLRKKLNTDFQVQREFGEQRNIWRIPLYNLFLTVMGGHAQFESYLRRTAFAKDTYLLTQLRALTIEWEALKVLTVKMHREYFSAKLSMEKCAKYKELYVEKLARIADMEEKAIYSFRKSYENIKSAKNDFGTSDGEEKAGENIFLALPYNEKTHMVDPEDFFVDDVIPYGIVWEKELLEFRLPEVERQKDNCMFCDGQVLKIGERVHEISFLIYATYGAQFEQLEVGYEGGIEKKEFSVSDWTEEPLHHERVMWSAGFKGKTPEKEDYTGKIAAIQLRLSPEKICEYIKLPQCKEIHIFAITISQSKSIKNI